MEHAKIKAVIFDMDGTILDTLADLVSSVNHSLETFGLPKRSTAEIRSFLGNGMHRLISLSCPEDADPETRENVLQEYRKYYPVHCADETRPYDGIPELLQELKSRGYLLAVVSNKNDEHVKKLAEEYFPGVFDIAVGASEGIRKKPAPDMAESALQILGVKKEEVLYIGDSEVDVQTAIAAGLPLVTVLWGFRDEEVLKAVGGYNFIKRPEEILGYLG